MTQSNAVSRVMLNLTAAKLTSVVGLKAQRGLAVTAPAKKTERSKIADTSHEMFGVTMSPVVAEKTSMAVVVHGVAEVSVVADTAWDTKPIGTPLYVNTDGQFTHTAGGAGAAIAGYFLQLHAHSTATMLLCPYRTHGAQNEHANRKFDVQRSATTANATAAAETQAEIGTTVGNTTAQIGASTGSISAHNIDIHIAYNESNAVLNQLTHALESTKLARKNRTRHADLATSDNVEKKAARIAEEARNIQVNKVYVPFIECLEEMITHIETTVDIADKLNKSTGQKKADMEKALNDQKTNAANLPAAPKFATLRSALEAFDVNLTKAYENTRVHGGFHGSWLLNLDTTTLNTFETEQNVATRTLTSAKTTTENAIKEVSTFAATIQTTQRDVETTLTALNAYSFDATPYTDLDNLCDTKPAEWSIPRKEITRLAAESIDFPDLTNQDALMSGLFAYTFQSVKTYTELTKEVTIKTNAAVAILAQVKQLFKVGTTTNNTNPVFQEARTKAKQQHETNKIKILALFAEHAKSTEEQKKAVAIFAGLNAAVADAENEEKTADAALKAQNDAQAQIDTLVRMGVTDRDMHTVFLGKNAPAPTKNVKPISRKRRATALNAVDDAMGGIRVTGDTRTDWQSTRNKHADLNQTHVFAAIAAKNSIL